MMARQLSETISCNGLEIMEAYPSSFAAWKETGTDENGTPTVTVHWMIPDRDGLTTTLSGSRFAKTGNIFPVGKRLLLHTETGRRGLDTAELVYRERNRHSDRPGTGS